MTPEPAAAPWEPSAWMRGAIERRRGQLQDLRIDKSHTDLVVAPVIGDWSGIAGTDEDRRCDRCRVYVPRGLVLFVGMVEITVTDGTVALLAFGLCSTCNAAEGLSRDNQPQRLP